MKTAHALIVLTLALPLPTQAAGGETIVVHEERGAAPDPLDNPVTVAVIEIDANIPQSADVAEALDVAAGATVQRLGGLGDWSAVSLRGANLRHTQVYLDGLPLNPDGAAVVNLSELPLRAFERIEVYRGGAPAALDASPLGGAVNLVTGERADGGSDAAVSYGSLDTARLRASTAVAGEVGETLTDLFLAADAFSTRGDFTYFSDNGTEYNLLDDHRLTRENNQKRQLTTHARWRLGERSLQGSLYSSFLSRDEGLAGHANFPATAAALSTLRHLGSAQVEVAGGAARGRLRLWRADRREDFDDPLGEIGVGVQDNRDHTASTGAAFFGGWAPRAWLAPSLALTARQDTFERLDQLTGGRDPQQTRYAYSGTPSVTLRPLEGRLVLTGSSRVTWLDNRSLVDLELSSARLTGAQVTWLGVDPRGGALLRITDGLAVAANGGWASRPPDMTELFGDRGAIEGNAYLRPERGFTWDAGARGRLARPRVVGSFEIAYFHNRMEDLILFVQNSQRTLIPVNIEDGRIRGIEAAGALSFHSDALRVEGSLTRSASENLSDNDAYAGNQLPRVPAWEAVERVGAGWGERLRAGHSYTYTAGSYWDRTNWYLSPPRRIHGLFVTTRPGPRSPTLSLDVLNLTDRVVEVVPRNPLDPADDAMAVQPITDFTGYPLPGRTFLLTVSWSGESKESTP